MRFNFQLQKLLEHRIDEEKKEQQTLACRMRQEEKSKRNLECLRADCTALQVFQRGCHKKHLDIISLVSLESYHYYLGERIKKAEIDLSSAAGGVKKQRIIVNEVMRRRQALEKLKEKAWESFCKKQKMMEQKVNDELSLYSYMRQVTDKVVHEG